jgi:hypothetical protein
MDEVKKNRTLVAKIGIYSSILFRIIAALKLNDAPIAYSKKH